MLIRHLRYWCTLVAERINVLKVWATRVQAGVFLSIRLRDAAARDCSGRYPFDRKANFPVSYVQRIGS
jgi:hypothetical protein